MVDSQDDFDWWSPQGAVTELSVEHSWQLLDSTTVGPLGVSIDNHPVIFPVNYVTDRGSLVFRTATGTKLTGITANNAVVFEVDSQSAGESWSVTITGTAQPIEPDARIESEVDALLPAWVPTTGYTYIRVTPTDIQGRRYQRHLHSVIHHIS